MPGLDLYAWILIAAGAALMGTILLRSIADGAETVASVIVVNRRADEDRRRADNAAAEAAGKAAMLEPLALNADGTIEEPIIGVVEGQ